MGGCQNNQFYSDFRSQVIHLSSSVHFLPIVCQDAMYADFFDPPPDGEEVLQRSAKKASEYLNNNNNNKVPQDSNVN